MTDERNENWLERSLRSASAEVATWPEWKKKAMRVLEVERSAEASRLDRALDLLERLVAAAERSADALERRHRPRAIPDPLPEPSETDRAAARRYARRLGVHVRGSR